MKLSSVHRKYFKMSRSPLVSPYMAGVIFAVLISSSVTVAEPQFTSAGFIDSEQDLLAMPSDDHHVAQSANQRSGPITQYAFDNVPLESQDNPQQQQGVQVVVAPPPQQQDNGQVASGYPSMDDQQQQQQQQQQFQQDQMQSQQQFQQDQIQNQQPLNGPAGGQIQSASGIPHFPIVDGHHFGPVPVPAVPVALGSPTTVFVPDDHHAVAVHHPGFYDLYHDFFLHPYKAVDYFFTTVTKMSIPQDHYLNVISFVGIYLFMTYLAYSTEDVFQ